MEKTSTGLEANVAGLLCYVLGWVSGLVFILIEKENKFVRFHAVQSIVVFGAITIVQIVLSVLSQIWILGVLFSALSAIVWLLGVILWIVLMVKAYQGAMFKLPWAGNFAEEKTK
ncbi:MAG TPA: DUF4870 domain-containing protein [Dehalococcoidia bacterium]|nr:DUF4870 domain-containing protein [Dehalococcoidia bacterium]